MSNTDNNVFEKLSIREGKVQVVESAEIEIEFENYKGYRETFSAIEPLYDSQTFNVDVPQAIDIEIAVSDSNAVLSEFFDFRHCDEWYYDHLISGDFDIDPDGGLSEYDIDGELFAESVFENPESHFDTDDCPLASLMLMDYATLHKHGIHTFEDLEKHGLTEPY